MAVQICQDNLDSRERVGALLLRNSWRSGLREGGYGWLQYDVLKGLAEDLRWVLKKEWIDTGQFEAKISGASFEFYSKLFCLAFGFGFGFGATILEGGLWARAFKPPKPK